MSLRSILNLTGQGPVPCTELGPLRGVAFDLPTPDPRLRALAEGAPAPTAALENLVGAQRAWTDWAEGMDFLVPGSPVYRQKRLERDLYWRRWAPRVPAGSRVLDLGGGIGRFTQLLLQQGCTVELVDPDRESLRRAVWHAAGMPGALDVHWTTGEQLPELAPVDVVIAAEVFCYVEDPARTLANVRRILKPGGPLLLSVEARWGWALALDVPPGGLEAWLGDGVLRVEGDRWVRTYDRTALELLLSGWRWEELTPTHYIYSGPFEAVAGDLEIAEVEALEARLRTHPIAGPLHRAWTGVAVYNG